MMFSKEPTDWYLLWRISVNRWSQLIFIIHWAHVQFYWPYQFNNLFVLSLVNRRVKQSRTTVRLSSCQIVSPARIMSRSGMNYLLYLMVSNVCKAIKQYLLFFHFALAHCWLSELFIIISWRANKDQELVSLLKLLKQGNCILLYTTFAFVFILFMDIFIFGLFFATLFPNIPPYILKHFTS